MGFYLEYTDNGKYTEQYVDADEFEKAWPAAHKIETEKGIRVSIEDEAEHEDHMRIMRKANRVKSKKHGLHKITIK